MSAVSAWIERSQYAVRARSVPGRSKFDSMGELFGRLGPHFSLRDDFHVLGDPGDQLRWDHLERRNAGGLASSGDRAVSAGDAGLPDLVEVTQASSNCRKMRSGEQNEKCAVASTCRNHPRRGEEPDPGEQIVQYTRALTSKPFHRLPMRGCAALPRKGMGRLWPGWRNFLGRPRQMWMSPVQRGMQCLPGED
jgi:hypothetical protein